MWKIFEVKWQSISPSTYPINSLFSVIVCNYKAHVSHEECFLRSNHCYDNWKSVIFQFPWQSLLGRQIPSLNNATYQSKLSLKKCSQFDKVYSRENVTKLYLVLHYYSHRPYQYQKCIKKNNFFFLIFTVITISLVGLICFLTSYFS